MGANNNSTSESTKENKEGDGSSMLQYKKNKTATNGVPGQLYEAKLNSIVLYRLLTDPKIIDFYMGSNLDEIGDMDDVCIRLIHEDCKKELLILIQAKHKDSLNKGIYDDELYRSSSDFYLPKNFKSFLKLKERYVKSKNDVLYLGKFEDIIPHFIFYTSAVNNTLTSQRIKEPNKNNPTINIVKNLINSHKLDGKVFQLNTTEEDFKKVTNDYTTGKRVDAEQFFENLYFFTDQAQQEGVGRELEKEIAINQASETSRLHVRPSAVFLNFYGKVQKWWLLQRKAEYLTKQCDYLNSTLSDVVINAYLSLLHYNYISYIELYSVQFNTTSMTYNNVQKEVVQELKVESNSTKANVFMIKTSSVLLTSIKLKDCLTHSNHYDRCAYLDYSYISKMSYSEFQIVLGEIKITETEILIIIVDTTLKVENERLINILNEYHKNIVIITNESQTMDLGNSHFIKVVDDHIDLIDLLNVENILQYKIFVQGEETDLSMIIDSKLKYSIISPDIILKILNQEQIELGRNLSNKHKMKNWYQERTVVLNKIENNERVKVKEYPRLRTLNNINEKIVIITAEPGMGKSTLLSLLSAETKFLYPKTWIIDMDLQDYSEDFSMWKENKIDIGLRESMLLVCKAELNKMTEDPIIDLLMTEDGNLKLINKNLRGTSLLLLELIVSCFNEGKIIFLFDGYDKMCPHYKRLTAKFIKNLISVPTNNKYEQSDRNRVWITSRTYNLAKSTLHGNLAEIYSLEPLSKMQQKDYYKKYWQVNMCREHLAINDLNEQQILTNIRNFLNNVAQNIQFSSTSSIPLQIIYETAREYLQEEYDFIDTERNISPFYPRDQILEEALYLAGIPLHMKIYASYFVKCFLNSVQLVDHTKNIPQNQENWDFKVNTFEFFEKFHESKLFKVFHKGKNQYYPDCRIRYNKAKKKSIKQYKILAFFSLFDEKLLSAYKRLTIIEDGYRLHVFQQFNSLINHIKKENENVGLIDGIRRGVPRFVHQALAECYAVEYVADLLKSFKTKPSIDEKAIDFIINYLLDNRVGLMTIFNDKLKSDKLLRDVLSTKNNKNIIFDVLIKQQVNKKNALHNVLDNGFKETANVLVQSVGKIDSGNITQFVDFLGGNFFIYAASFDYADLLEYVLCKIKEVDSLMIDYISDNVQRELNSRNIINKDYIGERLFNVGLKDMLYFTHANQISLKS